MTTTEQLWTESYQGEVLGETLFRLLAERQQDPEHRRQLEVLTLLERSTKELAEPLLEQKGYDRGDTAATVAQATEVAAAVADLPWEQFLGSFESVTKEFLARYRRILELTGDESERELAEAYVAHEQALCAFARRALGREAGEPLAEILALPHGAAAASASA
jgi:hypothetical protein